MGSVVSVRIRHAGSNSRFSQKQKSTGVGESRFGNIGITAPRIMKMNKQRSLYYTKIVSRIDICHQKSHLRKENYEKNARYPVPLILPRIWTKFPTAFVPGVPR